MVSARKDHWESVWSTKSPAEVSWYQVDPAISIALIGAHSAAGSVIDVGGGSSRLAARLLDLGYDDVTVLDIAAAATTDQRVARIVADVTAWSPARHYDVWHDRAAFHFLITAADRRQYAEAMAAAVSTGGHAIIATFALDGPEQCSALPVCRYDGAALGEQFAADFDLISYTDDTHMTPWQSTQHFTFVTLRRR